METLTRTSSLRIDIVVVNWNSGRYLAECIESIRSFNCDVVDRVVTVDNGSIDNSLTVDAGHLTFDAIRAGENLGFAKACNLGAARGVAPYILFLNPDAKLEDGTLAKSLAFMESSAAAQIGICGVRLKNEKDETQRCCARFPKARTFLGKALGLEGVIPAFFPAHFMKEFDHLTSCAVDQVIGAYFLVRRQLFEQLGGFDERFFVYFEEVDFTLRAKMAGWGTWYLADTVAFHKGGGVSEQVKAHRLFYSIRSRMLYAKKNMSGLEATAVIGLALFIEPVTRLLRAALRGSGQEVVDTLRGYGMIWRDLPGLFARGFHS